MYGEIICVVLDFCSFHLCQAAQAQASVSVIDVVPRFLPEVCVSESVCWVFISSVVVLVVCSLFLCGGFTRADKMFIVNASAILATL
jgi:hypothetical protein